MKFSLFLLIPVVLSSLSWFQIVESSDSVSDALRDEFRRFAADRLNYMLKNGTPIEEHLTMSISLTDCRFAAELPRVLNKWRQTILEEETCATLRMREWCEERAGRSGMMTIRDDVSNRTALAVFQCHFVDPTSSDLKRQHTAVQGCIHLIVIASYIGMVYSWYYTCTRPVPMHPSKILNMTTSRDSDSYESITFDRSRSRIAESNRSNWSGAAKKFRIRLD